MNISIIGLNEVCSRHHIHLISVVVWYLLSNATCWHDRAESNAALSTEWQASTLHAASCTLTALPTQQEISGMNTVHRILDGWRVGDKVLSLIDIRWIGPGGTWTSRRMVC
jgi:hypothetical protein